MTLSKPELRAGRSELPCWSQSAVSFLPEPDRLASVRWPRLSGFRSWWRSRFTCPRPAFWLLLWRAAWLGLGLGYAAMTLSVEIPVFRLFQADMPDKEDLCAAAAALARMPLFDHHWLIFDRIVRLSLQGARCE